MIPTRYNKLGVEYHSNTTWMINHGAGVLDIEITGASGLLWTFPDGSTSTSTRPIKTVTSGRTIIRCNNFRANGLSVFIHSASSCLSDKSISIKSIPSLMYFFYCDKANCLYGNIAEFPRVTYYLYLQYQFYVYGDMKDIPRVSSSLYLISTTMLFGNSEDVPSVNSILYLNGISGMTGNSSYLPLNIGAKYVYSCSGITGNMQIVSTNSPIYFYGNSSVSPAEYDQTIANCVSAGGLNKTLYISSRRTSASNADKATLISRGWTVNDSQI